MFQFLNIVEEGGENIFRMKKIKDKFYCAFDERFHLLKSLQLASFQKRNSEYLTFSINVERQLSIKQRWRIFYLNFWSGMK